MKYKQLKLYFGILIISLILSPLINAFGVATQYWDEKPLIMYPGETKNVYLELQNMVGDKDIKLKVELINGSEIATLIDSNKEYLVPFGKKDAKVNIKVKIPENVPLGNKYNIVVLFKELVEEESKMVKIEGAVEGIIPVVVGSISKVPVKETPETKVFNSDLLFILVIFIIIVIGYVILIKKDMKKLKKD